MRVRFRTNLGSDDAERFGLNFRDCTRGAEIEVPDDVGERLLQRFADRCESEAPTEIKAIPPVDIASKAIDELEHKYESLEAKVSKRRKAKSDE